MGCASASSAKTPQPEEQDRSNAGNTFRADSSDRVWQLALELKVTTTGVEGRENQVSAGGLIVPRSLARQACEASEQYSRLDECQKILAARSPD